MYLIANALLMFALVAASYAHDHSGDVYWHIDPSVKSCSMIIDPALTQVQWKTFVKQVGAITAFKSLSSAEPLGRMNFRVGIEYASTPIAQRNSAWVNTFAHPDADCPLGDAIVIPTIRASMGLTENMDIGAYWTTAPNANYGMVGGEVKYAFLRESEKLPAAAVRGSVMILTGVQDFDLNIYSVDLLASKRISVFVPYVGLRESLSIGTETTSKVNLAQEKVLVTQGYAGVSFSIWMLNLAAEYNISNVNTLAFIVGFTF
jgi:hypothetical protein